MQLYSEHVHYRLPVVFTYMYLAVDLCCSRHLHEIFWSIYPYGTFLVVAKMLIQVKKILLTVIIQSNNIFNDFSLPNFSYVWLRTLTCVFLCTLCYVILGYCFTPYQPGWLYNGDPLVAFYDLLGIRRTYSPLKPRRPHGGLMYVPYSNIPNIRNHTEQTTCRLMRSSDKFCLFMYEICKWLYLKPKTQTDKRFCASGGVQC